MCLGNSLIFFLVMPLKTNLLQKSRGTTDEEKKEGRWEDDKKELRCVTYYVWIPQDEYNHYILQICTNKS